VRPEIITDVVAAAHLSYRVISTYRERGGLFFVSYPQMLKSTMISTLRQFPDARVLSDMNAQQMAQLREAICEGRIRTVAFDEFNKLYQRNPTTAANLEGAIMAVVAQGWSGPAFRDQTIPPDPARCLVIGGLTNGIVEHRMKDWEATGFADRFLWCYYKLQNPSIIGDAIEAQRPIEITSSAWGGLYSDLPFDLSVEDRKEIRTWVPDQPGRDKIPYNLLLKIAVVLRWRYESQPATRGQNYHMLVLREFSTMIRGQFAELIAYLPGGAEHA
jgi:hypothetical protein